MGQCDEENQIQTIQPNTMKESIEVLQDLLYTEVEYRDSFRSVMCMGGKGWDQRVADNLPEDCLIIRDLAEMDSKIADYQAAIAHLQRKVKKDPRVDGLPELLPTVEWNGSKRSKCVLIWHKSGSVFFGKYHGFGIWWGSSDDMPTTTDEVLYYADPEEIV